MPITRLEIERSDPKSGLIGFGDPEQPGWVIHTFDSRILAHPSLLQHAHTRRQIKALQSQGEFQRRLKITLWFLASFALLAFMVSTVTGFMVRSLIARIPPKWEREMGDKWLAELKKEVTFVQDPKPLERLERSVGPLVSTLTNKETQYTFYLIHEEAPNAFALPGGNVVVTTGLMELADRPEELCGVVAHEIAHVTQKHLFRKAISSYGPYLLIRLFIRDENGLLGVLGESSHLLVSQSFSQEYEFEADSVGWQYLVAAHIDPRGAIDILTKLKAVQAATTDFDSGPRAFDSHPAIEKRIRRLEGKWKKLKDKSNFVAIEKEEKEETKKEPPADANSR
jgi:predicted Zn-dependent protease